MIKDTVMTAYESTLFTSSGCLPQDYAIKVNVENVFCAGRVRIRAAVASYLKLLVTRASELV